MRREPVLQAEYKAKLRNGDGAIVGAVFRCFDDSTINLGSPCRLVLRYADQELEAAAGDYFAALDKVRLQLELVGIVPLVNGVGKGRYPSGMARDMGSGLSVYRLRLGVRSTIADLIDTFAEDDLTEPATVEEQRLFYVSWLGSFASEA